MPPNTQQQGAETRSIQRSVQVLLTVSGIVFLLAGLVLAASGASVSSAIGSVTDRFDDSSQPTDDDIDSSNGDAADGGSGNETDDTNGDSGDTGDGGDNTDGDTGDGGDGDSDGGDGDGDNGNSDDDSDGGDSDDGNTGGDDSDNGDNGDNSDGDDGTHTLTVSVVDQDGDAVDGADVSLDDSTDEKTTGGDGEVEWELEDGTYGVTANADGYQSAEDNAEIDGDDESVELTLEEEDDSSDDNDSSDDDDSSGDDDSSDGSNSVTFIVEDQNGDPLDNATVALERETLFKEEKTVDQNGEVDFERGNGTYSFTVTVDGNESDERTVEVDGDMEQPVTYETTDG